MVHCRECRYWDRQYEYRFRDHNGCKHEKLLYDAPSSYANHGKGSKYPSDSLVYWDSEDYSARMITGPDFGCVHGKKLGDLDE